MTEQRRPEHGAESMRFYPKEENFPDDILCPLCTHHSNCIETGDTCRTIEMMQTEMEECDAP